MSNSIKIGFVMLSLVSFSCGGDEPISESCRINIVNSSIVVTANVSGEEGTQITPDEINQSSISTTSAEVSFKVHKVGRCHEVQDYGHVWSFEYATPTIENANQSNYGSNVNFGDQVKTIMNDLIANRKYYVRGYVKVRGLEDNSIKILYNDNISSFTTMRECDDGDTQIIDDSDRITIVAKDKNVSVLSFELFRERIAACENGAFTEVPIQKKYTSIKNLTPQKISCDYEIKYKQLNSDGSVWSEWVYNGIITDLNPNEEVQIYLTDQYGTNFKSGETIIALSNIRYG